MITHAELQERVDLARMLLSSGRTSIDDQPLLDEMGVAALPLAEAQPAALPSIPFPAGLKPVPQPFNPRPASSDKLPEADVVVVTWTVAEHEALCDVLTRVQPSDVGSLRPRLRHEYDGKTARARRRKIAQPRELLRDQNRQ
jgi:hypothetical protein